MDWLLDLFIGNTIIHACVIIFLVSAVGIALGRLKFFGISLGISFVLFVGIFAGHLGMTLDTQISQFVQNFGLSIFVFTLGLQVGPSFFTTLRSGGLSLNLLSLAVVFLNLLMCVGISSFASIPLTEMIGVMSGAVTNTPVLGAAQQSLAQFPEVDVNSINDMALACAITYPFGVIGAILVVLVLNIIFKNLNGDRDKQNNNSKSIKPEIVGVHVTNSKYANKTVLQLREITNTGLIVTRILRKDVEISATANSEIHLDDKLLMTIKESDKDFVIKELGEICDINVAKMDSELVSRKIFVTQDSVNGKSIEQLKIRKEYNVNITRVNRSGIYLIADKDLKLFVGDRVVLVGDAKDVQRVEVLLGNTIKKIDEPHLITIFTGIVLGLIVGSIPLVIPGVSVPVKMGLAGGTIIVGILMGAFGYRLKFNTYTTISANLMLRELGIVTYLAALGISSGVGFYDSIVSGNGIEWLMWGSLITLIPIFIVGFIAIKFLKKDSATVFGMLCGSVANSPALAYTTETTGKNDPAVAYATVYPLTIFIRVLSAQILAMTIL